MLSSYLILFGLGILIAWPVFKVSPSDVISIIEERPSSEYLGMLKFLQVLYSVGLFLVPSILGGYMIHRDPWDYLKANRKVKLSLSLLVIFLMFVSVPWINYLGYLNEELSLPERWAHLMDKIRLSDEDSWELMKSYLSTQNGWGLLFNLFMIALIPSIGEEFLFRGTLQRIFTDWFKTPHPAVWLSALLFSLAHFQFLGFIPRMMLGALFGYIFLWTGNIWLSVLAHLMNNTIGVIYYYLFLQAKLGIDPQELGMRQNPALFITGSVLLTLIGLYVIRQGEKISTDPHTG
jgi:membrane protease YdiL (CAAX protease family)